MSYITLHHSPDHSLDTRWRECLADSDHAAHYTSPEYFDEPMCRDKRPFAVLAIAGERVTGVLTGIHDGGRVQSGLSVRPQIALSRQGDRTFTMTQLISGLLAERRSEQLVDLFVWADMKAVADSRFRSTACEGVVMLDLSLGPDALFRRFSENKRINIRKAIKLGVSVEHASCHDDVAEYYRVYVDWSHRKALPFVGEEQFQETMALTSNRRLLVARHAGRIIAGIVLRFYPGGLVEYAANSSLDSALHLRPNDLLHWRAIEWAYAEGLKKYSLGGTHLFLRKFGGEVVATTRHRVDCSLFRRHAIADWFAEKAEGARPFLPQTFVAIGRSLRTQLKNSAVR